MTGSSAPGPAVTPVGIGAFGCLVVGFGVAVTTVWCGAALAAAATGHAGAVPLDRAGQALIHLPGHLSDPAAAWPSPVDEALPAAVVYWACQVLVTGVAGTGGFLFWRLWRYVGSDGPRPFGVEAEAGFAQRKADLARVTVDTPTPGRVTVGRCRGQLVATELDASLAVVGPSGCGKTAGFAIPALLEWDGPVIATSVKSDLIDATIAHRSRGEADVWVYDPTGCTGLPAARWSPLDACRTWAGAMRVAAWMAEAAQPRNDTLADADYWYSQARKGLAPYLHAAAVTKQSMGTVIRWIDTQDEDEVAQALYTAARVDPETGEIRVAEVGARFERLREASIEVARDLLRKNADPDLATKPFEKWPDSWRARVENATQLEWMLENAPKAKTDPLAPLNAAKALWGKEPRLKGSVFATIENVLAGWADPAVTASADGNDIDLDRWLAGNNTLYVVATPHEQARLRPVLTVLIQQAVRRAYDTAAANKGRLPRPCLVLLDEAGNISPLRDLPAYASTARSHAITLVTIWQDLAQIRAIYNDRARTVLNNHRAKLFGSGIADADTLDYVSKLLGDEARTERNLSADLAGDRRSISEHRTYRRTASADVIRRIPPGDGVLIYGADLPAHVRLRPWFDDPTLRRAGGVDASPAERKGLRRALLPR
jgi:type IV secretion system protein VirD4